MPDKILCKKHPKYQAKRKPTAKCSTCRSEWRKTLTDLGRLKAMLDRAEVRYDSWALRNDKGERTGWTLTHGSIGDCRPYTSYVFDLAGNLTDVESCLYDIKGNVFYVGKKDGSGETYVDGEKTDA